MTRRKMEGERRSPMPKKRSEWWGLKSIPTGGISNVRHDKAAVLNRLVSLPSEIRKRYIVIPVQVVEVPDENNRKKS